MARIGAPGGACRGLHEPLPSANIRRLQLRAQRLLTPFSIVTSSVLEQVQLCHRAHGHRTGAARERGLRVHPGSYRTEPTYTSTRRGRPTARSGIAMDCGRRPLILSAGRLSPEKRMDVLLDAAARLSPRHADRHSRTGPDEARLRHRRSGRTRREGAVSCFVPDRPPSHLPAGRRLRHRVRGGAAEPDDYGSDGDRPAV